MRLREEIHFQGIHAIPTYHLFDSYNGSKVLHICLAVTNIVQELSDHPLYKLQEIQKAFFNQKVSIFFIFP